MSKQWPRSLLTTCRDDSDDGRHSQALPTLRHSRVLPTLRHSRMLLSGIHLFYATSLIPFFCLRRVALCGEYAFKMLNQIKLIPLIHPNNLAQRKNTSD